MKCFIFGYGYTAQAVDAVLGQDWDVVGTSRTPKSGLIDFNHIPTIDATHILVTISPDEQGDPVLNRYADLIRACPNLQWIGYLSTTGVYGDHQGAWVDETTPPTPNTARSRVRLDAEKAWLNFGEQHLIPVHIFRVAGIYGPGRDMIKRLREGTAQNIVKKGQVFSRIHVTDLARVIVASMQQPQAGEIYNVCDDEPTSAQDVMAYVAKRCDLPMPSPIAFEDANLSPMAKSFYQSNRRVRNDKIKAQLGVQLQYPTFREGYDAIIKSTV